MGFVCLLFVGCLTSQQQASVSQGRICEDNFTCCHTETEVADPTFYLTKSQYTDTRPTSPSADPIMPCAWQGSHWSANFEVSGMTRPGKIPWQTGFKPWIFRSRSRCLNHLASEAVMHQYIWQYHSQNLCFCTANSWPWSVSAHKLHPIIWVIIYKLRNWSTNCAQN